MSDTRLVMSVIEICTLDIQQASIFWSIRVYHQIGFDIRKQDFWENHPPSFIIVNANTWFVVSLKK